MRELGWVEGQNLVVEARWAEGRSHLLPELMTEVIRRKVDVIFTYHTARALAAKNATSTIPVLSLPVSLIRWAAGSWPASARALAAI